MKFKKTKIAALALAGVLGIAPLAGCELVTKDPTRDLVQVVAEVDITKNAAFSGSGEFSSYKSVITPSEILKRELIASYASYSSSLGSSTGLDSAATYNSLIGNLVNRQIYVQYAFAYFLQNGADIEDGDALTHVSFSVDAFNSAVSGASAKDKEIAGMRYFLTEDEINKAEYDVKVSINSTLDAQEHEIIEESHDHSEESSTSSSRTTPTGVDATKEDYYDSAYKIYTGVGSGEGYSTNPSDCGSYEKQDGSTPASRKQAYKVFLARLNTYGLVNKGENTSDVTSLSYYSLERKSSYETALLTKLDKAFERTAEAQMTEEWLSGKFNDTLVEQEEIFSQSDDTQLKSALDQVSDSNFVLYAPEGYGFVINILLPFSAAQSQELSDSLADMNDKKGNTFQKRASLLQKLTATDQRGAWFDADYGFRAEESDEAFGGEDRGYLFFENNLKKSGQDGVAQYEQIDNYIGKYSYNGSVYEKEEDGETKFVYKPNKIDIDGFLTEMENYLQSQGLTLTEKETKEDYYTQTDYYNEDGEVDYSKFLYYSAKISELDNFNANEIFRRGSTENKAMSVINELSFAYNTDTGGLNSYLGYAVSPNKTDFVSEFEYAAQQAVRMGAGAITVAPSVYGWHIMYCTLSYSQNDGKPFAFDWSQKDVEGTFSNLYFEAMKPNDFSVYSEAKQQSIVNEYKKDSVTIYEDRYADRISA